MRTVVIGNSGAGKSTLARALAAPAGTPLLDLDTIVWEPGKIAVPRPIEAVHADLDRFCAEHAGWIAEGCYGGLAERLLGLAPGPARDAGAGRVDAGSPPPARPELIFMNPGEAACLRNCRARPWEPHKYVSKAEQDEKLAFLLAWVSDYYRRTSDASLARHRAIFDAYDGPKREITEQP
jgi:adenylate kinase family enzyme